MSVQTLGRRCLLVALPRGHKDANGHLRCKTCLALVPTGDLTSLTPGQCPGERRPAATS